ncbi:DegV family protein [Paenibacillus abyssi]|uniref:Fatty acid-binding protein DegV n=1 Tax=Paenibacillus abyssi TaxID=1340531 RepID=A0A917D4S1_9BACL|nr:DegV family protein [Paenibacillus abyssi]GGG12826.1 fatty acid-binding protein DegV [Paenibacillus abyssi]
MSSKIRIVTDSTSDIPSDVRERLGIEMVPLKVHFGVDVFMDGVTIESDEFYTKLAASEKLPTTSQPSPADFMEVYQRILQEEPGVQIISIHLSSALSGTYQSAVLANSLIEEEADITVIDSKSASYGFGKIVVAAAQMVQAGSTKEEILAEVQRLRNGLGLYFLVDTLEFLQKGGRIGKAAALFGTILNIKPILTVDDEGTVAPVDKVRGKKKAMQRIVDLLKEDFGNDPVHITLAYSKYEAGAQELHELAKVHFNIQETNYTKIGAVIGTHVGPGAAAIFMFRA